MAQVIEINDGDTVNVIEVQLPFYGIASSELEFGARAAEAITVGNVVYVSGATGTHIQVSKAQANAEATSAGTIGIAKESASTNGDLQVVTFGIMSNLNTQAYTAGQVLYLSTSVSGGYQTTLPAAPNHGVKLGWVVRSHPSQGQIFVAVQNYQELEELSDVSVAGVTDGQVLTYQSSSGTWIPSTPNPGDITAVNVTSPITGGGTSGAVTVGIDQSALSLTASQISDGSTTWARLAAANTFSVGGHIIANSQAAAVPLRLRGAASQSANLLEIQNDAATTIGYFSASGVVYGRGVQSGSASFSGVTFNGISNPSGTTSLPSLVVKAITSQTANLQEWQLSDGTVRAYVRNDGLLHTSTGLLANGSFVAAGGFIANTQFSSVPNTASVVGAIIRGAASQSANLQEWQDSAGTILSRVDSSGYVYTQLLRSTLANSPFLSLTSASEMLLRTGAAANKGLVIRGESSQSANLQEWQNTSATILARVDTSGAFTAVQYSTSNNLGRIGEASSGGFLRLARMTAQASSPGNNVGTLYLRDGTNAGTLKLVVRAGAAGAETTILDNIPQ